ncbi:hypothetical protein QOZ96_003496 [Brevundimonas nasdae]|uniref:DUF4129 domain-containing protein n=1 Tax=Brevundimonas nasdae TaxID=172043 RepID=UPI00191217C8|nr:DUF4129 domain-containing protein [Brevundimonas nasdae]MBK6026728.1 hypothetical protein [Brevundimonas nasdae]MDQ0453523.1 hypothetical protein [Brevundimonas nasdae]
MQDRAKPSDDALQQAHDRLLRDDSFQFDRTGYHPPKIPQWPKWIGDMLDAIAPALKWVLWIGLALLAAAILYLIIREILRLRAPRAKPDKPKAAVDAEWRPDAQAARDLLAGADALAAEGRYAEAAHLLLLRSVEDIDKHQPRALRISLTTREIAGLTSLPEAARPAFMKIGRVVERSLFGGAPVDAEDFADCRDAYEAFALPEGWRA